MIELSSLLKNAQNLSGRINDAHEQLNQVKAKGSAAGGLVTIEVNGHQSMLSCKIDPELFQRGDHELLEELVVSAANAAVEESRVKQGETLQSIAGDSINITTLGEVLSKLMPK
ncbi:MAG: YbaB/EbfC family nucleoid-associated protein [Planctomycetaceae bacterium]|jgi:DNA-binding YbaB/EbfC family protein|nr:YbaB/EbfC family nucleoid-associated protein [Planctomycetaceae bacterium]